MSSCGDFLTKFAADEHQPAYEIVGGCLRHIATGNTDCTFNGQYIEAIKSVSVSPDVGVFRIEDTGEKHFAKTGSGSFESPGEALNLILDYSVRKLASRDGVYVIGITDDDMPDVVWGYIEIDLGVWVRPGLSYWIELDADMSVVDYDILGNFTMFPQEIRDAFCFDISKCIGFFQGHLNCVEDVCSTYLNPPDVPPPPVEPPPLI